MTREEFFNFHKQCTEKMYAITEAKNKDYAGPSDDNPFANFSLVADARVCSTESGFLVRMLDKVCRLSSFVQAGKLHVKDETAEDTLLDLANYCILLAGYLKSKRDEGVVCSSKPVSPIDKVTFGCIRCGNIFPLDLIVKKDAGIMCLHCAKWDA